jgi:glycosyltransferase involved in cell wall biosynthesis
VAKHEPDVTVVVPTRNSGRTIVACLESLRAQTYRCRVVVIDNGSSDMTRELASTHADVVHEGGPERSAQRNIGVRLTSASIVGFIDSDMIVSPRVVEEAVQAITGGAGCVIVPEQTVGVGFWVAVRAFERSFYEGADNIEAARFYDRAIFERVGGFDEELTGPEDLDLTVRARRFAPVARTSEGICHDEGRLRYLEACRKKAYYAPGLRRYVRKRGREALLDLGRRRWLTHPQALLCPAGLGLLALKGGESVAVLGSLARERIVRTDRAYGSKGAGVTAGHHER